LTGPTIVRELLLEMGRNVAILEELRAVPPDRFLGDPRHYLLAERCFQLAIQCLLDVCSYLASMNGWPKPEESRDAILLMGSHGVLPPEFAQCISGMAGFRNILVHAYLKIDRRVVQAYLGHLDDFRTFALHVEKLLQPSGA
jgi:uncharacterized protein YutE (UPF0331/DUF86 family)